MSRTITITISDEDEAAIRDFLAHHLQHSRVREVLALLDAATPAVDLATVAWTKEELDDVARSFDRERKCVGQPVTDDERAYVARVLIRERVGSDRFNEAVRDRARALLAARGKVAT